MLRWKMMLPVLTAIVALGLCTCSGAFFGADSVSVALPPAPTRTVPAPLPTSTPTSTPSPTHTPTQTPTATPSFTPTPSPSPTPTDTATPTATPTQTPTLVPTSTATNVPPVNRPPIVTRFIARFVAAEFSTIYELAVTDPDGDKLTFKWSNTNTCGTFTWSPDVSSARWAHPSPFCPHDSLEHPGTITVIIDDRRGGIAQCVDTAGSAIEAWSRGTPNSSITCTP